MTYLAQGNNLYNPNLYIVLADYGQEITFLDPLNYTSSTTPNTVAGALGSLKALRNYGGTP